MKSFKDYQAEMPSEEISNTHTEAMTLQQRQKAKATFRKNKAKIMMGRKKAAKKIASKEKLQGRAIKQARNIIIQKILKTKKKDELSFAARSELEKKVDKKKGAIKKIAKKLLPQIRKAEKLRLSKRSSEK